jgi:hypothetical protein
MQVLCPWRWQALAEPSNPGAHPAAPAGVLAAVTAAAGELVRELALGLTPAGLADGEAGGAASAALLQAALACSSAAVPYQQRRDGSAGAPVAALAASASGGQQQQQQPFDQALVSCLVAAQQLLKLVPGAQLGVCAQPLLALGLRLLHTAAPGVQLSASQRYVEGWFGQLLGRCADAGGIAAAAIVSAQLQLTDAVAAALDAGGGGGGASSSQAAERLPALLGCQLAGLTALGDAAVGASASARDAAEVEAHALAALGAGGWCICRLHGWRASAPRQGGHAGTWGGACPALALSCPVPIPCRTG